MNVNEATLVYADEYNRMAETYDRVVAPRLEPMARTVVELLAPKAGEMVLDIATGTGLLACLLAPRVAPAQVVAIDLADEAIRVASYRAGTAGLRNLRFELMDARYIIYHGAPFDAIGSNLGIPNIGYDRTFYEVHRLLKSGGRFVFSEWDRSLPASELSFYELLEIHRTPVPSPDLSRVREAVALNRSSPEARDLRNPPVLAKKLESFGFSSVRDAVRTFPVHFNNPQNFISFMTAWGWDEREMAEMPPDHRQAFETELASRLQDRTGRHDFKETWTIHFIEARV